MKKYEVQNVRGAGYCSIILQPSTVLSIESYMNMVRDEMTNQEKITVWDSKYSNNYISENAEELIPRSIEQMIETARNTIPSVENNLELYVQPLSQQYQVPSVHIPYLHTYINNIPVRTVRSTPIPSCLSNYRNQL